MKGVSLMADKDKAQGFIKIYRQMLDWEWYTDIVVKTVFIHCLFRANYKDTEWRGVRLKRGQFITSYANLAKECGLSVSQVRRAISALCSTGEITHKPQARYSVVTVVEYNSYQADNRLRNKKSNNQTTSSQQQIKNIKNTKNTKEEKNAPASQNPWIGIADDGEEYFIDYKKYEEWNREHGIVED